MKKIIVLLCFLLFFTSPFFAQEYTNSDFSYMIKDQEIMIENPIGEARKIGYFARELKLLEELDY